MRKPLIVTSLLAFGLALGACAQIGEYTGLTPEQQLCLAMRAGELNAVEEIIAAGLSCLVLAPAE